MTAIPHKSPVFDVVKFLQANLDSKRGVLTGLLLERDRVERSITRTTEEIVDIEAALAKLQAEA